MSYPECECGHENVSHEGEFDGKCSIYDCTCRKFKLAKKDREYLEKIRVNIDNWKKKEILK